MYSLRVRRECKKDIDMHRVVRLQRFVCNSEDLFFFIEAVTGLIVQGVQEGGELFDGGERQSGQGGRPWVEGRSDATSCRGTGDGMFSVNLVLLHCALVVIC